jgi:hypothetical protein
MKNYKKLFFERIDKIKNGCWEWKGPFFENGYGQAPRYKNKSTRAHRISWMLFNGNIPKDMLVLHKCDNKKCVNPKHLFIGTQKDNIRDMMNKGRDNFYPLFKNGYGISGESSTSKLTKKEVAYIRKEYTEKKITPKELSKKYNISRSAIYKVIHHETWKCVK